MLVGGIFRLQRGAAQAWDSPDSRVKVLCRVLSNQFDTSGFGKTLFKALQKNIGFVLYASEYCSGSKPNQIDMQMKSTFNPAVFHKIIYVSCEILIFRFWTVQNLNRRQKSLQECYLTFVISTYKIVGRQIDFVCAHTISYVHYGRVP